MSLADDLRAVFEGADKSLLAQYWPDDSATSDSGMDYFQSVHEACAAIGRENDWQSALRFIKWAALEREVEAFVQSGGHGGAKAATETLWMADSEFRLPLLLGLMDGLPKADARQLFLEFWTVCDDTWPHRDRLIDTLRRLFGDGQMSYRTSEDQAFHTDLSNPTTLWRGCSRERVKGVAWTTDRDIAVGFAEGHRGIPVPDPVLVQATVRKDAVFFVYTGRTESEVVVDPDKLSGICIHKL